MIIFRLIKAYMKRIFRLIKAYIQAYKSVYDAAVFCMAHDGQLAEQVLDFKSALELCSSVRGICRSSHPA